MEKCSHVMAEAIHLQDTVKVTIIAWMGSRLVVNPEHQQSTLLDTTNIYDQPTQPIPKYLFQCSVHLVAITSKGLITTATTNPDRKAANKLFCQAGLPGPNISVTLV